MQEKANLYFFFFSWSLLFFNKHMFTVYSAPFPIIQIIHEPFTTQKDRD